VTARLLIYYIAILCGAAGQIDMSLVGGNVRGEKRSGEMLVPSPSLGIFDILL